MLHSFRKTLESGHFAVTAELTPPREAELESLGIAAGVLKPAVTAINLTDGAGARVRLSSLGAAIHLRQLGIEPILQMTCRDRNRIAMQSDLLTAAACSPKPMRAHNLFSRNIASICHCSSVTSGGSSIAV